MATSLLRITYHTLYIVSDFTHLQDDDAKDDESHGVHACKVLFITYKTTGSITQSVPGTGDDKDKGEDKGMTMEEKKEAERLR